MEKLSIGEVIEQAIQTERLGHEFYIRMAKKFEENDGLRKLFEMLAQKELRHKVAFSELKEIIGEKEPDDWEEVTPYFRAMAEAEFFLGKDKSLPSLEHIKTAHDAVRFAIGFEKDTMLYFVGLRDAVKEKEIVDEIINEEKSHMLWLTRFGEGISR